MFTLDGASAAPNFVRTSGAPTVIRVGPPSQNPTVLAVDAIAWRQPTRGPMPDPATTPDGGINEALVPDFVSVWAADGVTIAGYVTKRDLLEGPDMTPGGTPSDPPQALPIPVYGDDLVTLVGHSVPGVGFVALGSTESPVPPSPSLVPASVGPSAQPSAEPSDEPPVVECGRIGPGAMREGDRPRAGGRPRRGHGCVAGRRRRRVCADGGVRPRIRLRQPRRCRSRRVPTRPAGSPIQVTGREYDTPTDAKRSLDDIPAHIVALLTAEAARDRRRAPGRRRDARRARGTRAGGCPDGEDDPRSGGLTRSCRRRVRWRVTSI